MADADPLVAFYLGTGVNGSGRTLEQVLRGSFRQLEIQHDYIQWLFPLATRSSFNPDAPLVTPRVGKRFCENPILRSRVIKALGVMLHFYGLTLDDSDPEDITIYQATHFRDRAAAWLSPDNHNYRRLTRILISLRLLGLRSYSTALLAALEKIYREHGGRIGSSIKHWRATALNA